MIPAALTLMISSIMLYIVDTLDEVKEKEENIKFLRELNDLLLLLGLITFGAALYS